MSSAASFASIGLPGPDTASFRRAFPAVATQTQFAAVLRLLVSFAWFAFVVSGSQRTAFVSSAPQLSAALRNNSVETIVVVDSIALKHNHSAPHNAFHLTRNLTIEGQPGSRAVLDLNWADGLLQLCSTCTWTVRNLTVTDERWGTGPGYDIVWGKPGSRVISENVLRLRLACTPPELPFKTINGSSRSSAFPDADRPQVLSIRPINVHGQEHKHVLVYQDVSLDMPLEHNEGSGFSGGYALSLRRDALLCQHTVSAECLARKSADACVDNLLDKLTLEQEGITAPGATANATAPAPQLPNRARAAAIAVPVAVSAVALLMILWLMLRKHKLKQELAKAQQSPRAAPNVDYDLQTGSASYTLSPMGAHKGWELYSSLTSPLVGDVDDDKLQFGELLGAGSFGRVFKGRFAGRTVAIKVIEHSSSTIAAVENEVRLMLSFNHQHLVRALHCVTFVSPHVTPTSGGREGAGSDCCSSDDPTGSSGRSSGHRAGVEEACQGMVSPGSGDGLKPERQQSDTYHSTIGSAYGLPGQHLGSANGTWGGLSDRSEVGSRRAETRLVLEFCDCGTMRSYVGQFWRPEQQQQPGQQQQQRPGDADGSMDELRLLMLLHGVAAGLEVLHSSNVVHGDLNAHNVLVSSNSAAPFGAVAKVSDLGLARVMGENRTHRTTHTLGTLNHLPPELLRSGKMSPAGDIYAFGIMLFELYAGTTAFRKLHNVGQFYETVVVHNLRPLVPDYMPADLQLLMEHCWAGEPQSRPTAEQVTETLRSMILHRRKAAAMLPGIAEADGAITTDQQLPQRESSRAAGSGFFRLGSRGSSRADSAVGSRLDSRSGVPSFWRWGSRSSGSVLSQGSWNAAGGVGYSSYDHTFSTYDTFGTLDTCNDTAFDSRGSCSTQQTNGNKFRLEMAAAGPVPASGQPPQQGGLQVSPAALAAQADQAQQRPQSVSGGHDEKLSLLDQLRQASLTSLMNGSFTRKKSLAGENSGNKFSQTGLWFV